MATLNVKRLNALPGTLEVSTLYFIKNADNANYVDIILTGNSLSDTRRSLGIADVEAEVQAAIAALTAADIPDLPGSKIISDLTVGTSGNAATATQLAAPFTLTLTGDATGSAQIDGSGAVNLAVSVSGIPSVEGFTGTLVKAVVEDGLVKADGGALVAADIPSLPGTKITSAISVDTSGNAATATLAANATTADSATTADRLTTGANINGVLFTGAAPITISAEDTATPRVPTSAVGVTVAPLIDGLVPREMIPLTFDNMEEFPTRGDFPATGRSEVIYVAVDTNLMYRWGGSDYIQISSGGGVVDEANRLTVARTISISGAATGSTTFDGSKNEDIVLTLAPVGTPGVQGAIVTTDAAGRVIASEGLSETDIPDLSGDKIISTLSVDTTGNAATATQLATPFNLSVTGDATGTVAIDGSGDVSLALTVTGGGTSGFTGSATKVTVADGLVTAGEGLAVTDIPDLPGTKITSDLTVGTSGNAGTATSWATPMELTFTGDVTGSVEFDGAQAVSTALTLAVPVPVIEGYTGTATKVIVANGLVQSAGPLVEADIPDLSGAKITSAISVDTSGNAATATTALNAVNSDHAIVADGLEIVADW